MKPFYVTSIFIVFLAAAPAWAQEQTKPAAEDDVSTLNGELVEVGSQNRYRQTYKRWNIATNPISWIWGSYGLSVSHAPFRTFAVRGDVHYFDFSNDSGFELSAAAPIYFRKIYSGLYLEPALTVKLLARDTAGVVERTTVLGPQVSTGWHWYWDSGLNAQLSVGIGRNWNTGGSEELTSDYDKLFFTGALRFGFAF